MRDVGIKINLVNSNQINIFDTKLTKQAKFHILGK